MRFRGRRVWSAIALFTVTLPGAGCTTEGKPTSTSTPVHSASGSAPQTSSARPREVDLAGVDACKVLTQDQEMALDYDKGYQRSPQPGNDAITNAPNCSYSSRNRGLGVLIAAVTTEGLGAWLNNPDRPTATAPVPVTVAGFPALRITVPPSEPRPDKCFILLDVHNGQYLDVFASKLASSGPTGSDTYCKEATRVAEMALTTIESS